MSGKRRAICAITVVVLVATTALFGGSGVISTAGAGPAHRPVIFVHGFAGSGSQFEAQAMRLTSNGYSPDDVVAHEYDSLFGIETQSDVLARLDALIAEMKAQTGSDQVDLLGHSLGTGLMQAYLTSDPARAANVAHYVNLDGAQAGAPPGGVPTLAVWGAGDPSRQVVGATNVYFPDQTHVQVVTSSETFVEIYRFFNDADPIANEIVRQPAGQVTIAGRAVKFISNESVVDAQLDIYETEQSTGERTSGTPAFSKELTGDATWGPFNVNPSSTYEFVLTRGEDVHHLYFQPFPRTNHMVRLLTSDPGVGLDALWEKSANHTNLAIVRNKEWWGDQGSSNDILEVNGINVINAATAPQSKRAVGVFVYDAGVDGVTNTDVPIPVFFGLPFLTAIDVNLAAATPPDGTISIAATPRGGQGVETINVPNWASSTDSVSVQFHDFHVTQAAPGEPTSTTTQPASTAPAVTPSFTG
jgi:pimeloyl-ACP methyl ester carboxylesterase